LALMSLVMEEEVRHFAGDRHQQHADLELGGDAPRAPDFLSPIYCWSPSAKRRICSCRKAQLHGVRKQMNDNTLPAYRGKFRYEGPRDCWTRPFAHYL
jgi:hypothetical protein